MASGLGAESMISSRVGTEYYGFDYFDESSKEDIREKLEDKNTQVFLFEGDIKKTIPRHLDDLPEMDMIHIDLSGADAAEAKELEKFACKNLKSLLHPGSVLIMHEDSFKSALPEKDYYSNSYHQMLKKRNLVVVKNKQGIS